MPRPMAGAPPPSVSAAALHTSKRTSPENSSNCPRQSVSHVHAPCNSAMAYDPCFSVQSGSTSSQGTWPQAWAGPPQKAET